MERPTELRGTEVPNGVVGAAEWLRLPLAAERVGGSAIPPVVRSFVDYCAAVEGVATRYDEFEVDLTGEPSAEAVASFDGLGLGAA